MATKVSVFGQEPEVKQLKKIEFVKVLSSRGILEEPSTKPCDWRNIRLLEKGCKTFQLDLMMAWDLSDIYKEKYIVLGHWNDGIV